MMLFLLTVSNQGQMLTFFSYNINLDHLIEGVSYKVLE